MRGVIRAVLGVGLCLLLAVARPDPVLAVPARPALLKVVQPDGTSFESRLRGDEWYHWRETTDGYTIVRDPKSQFWTYAVRDEDGYLAPSKVRVGQGLPSLLGVSPGLKDEPAIVKARRLAGEFRDDKPRRATKATGTVRGLVILANFSDTTPNVTRQELDDLYNKIGFHGSDGRIQGSVRDYFAEASYGKFDFRNTVAEWVTLPQARSYYANNSRQMVLDGLAALEARGLDFSQFDGDGDHWIDSFDVIHQGRGQEESGDPNDIWSHQWWLSSPVTKNGVQIQAFHTEPEVHMSSRVGRLVTQRPGVICHESGHFFGLPDLYDTDYSSEGAGLWELMAAGSWNGDWEGASPAQLSAWCKAVLGWVTPSAVKASCTVSLRAQAQFPDVIAIKARYPLKEYLLFENRADAGFDRALPAHGLLVWHIDETRWPACFDEGNDCNNTETTHYMVSLVQADGLKELENRQSYGDSGDPYPGSTDNRRLDDNTNPDLRSYTLGATGLTVTNISAAGPEMSFSVSVPGALTGLSIRRLAAAKRQVSAGSTVGVSLTLGNDLSTRVDISSEKLVITGSNLSIPDLATIRSIPALGTTTFQFQATALSVGSCSITSAVVRGFRGDNGSQTIIANNLAAPLALEVVEPAPGLELSLVISSATTVGVGEKFPVFALFRNTGTAAARLSRAQLVFEGNQLSASPVALTTTVLPDGGWAVADVEVTAVSTGTGVITSVAIEALDLHSNRAVGLTRNLAWPAFIEVVEPVPRLHIYNITAERTTVGMGQSFLATVWLINDGSGPATATARQLGLSNANVRLNEVLPNATRKVLPWTGLARFTFACAGASLGNCTVTTALFTAVSATGNTTAPILGNDARPVTITVVNAVPAVKVVSIVPSRSTVNVGQSANVTVNLRNDGTGIAKLSSQRLVLSGVGAASALDRAVSMAAGGSTAKLDFPFSSSSAGTCRITSLTISATNPWTGQPVGLSSNLAVPAAITVQTPAALTVGPITVGRGTLVRGQPGVVVSVGLTQPVSAAVGAAATGLACALRIGTNSSGYTVNTVRVPPSRLAAGTTTSASFAVDVLPTALLGSVPITAEVRGYDANTGVACPVTNTAASTWTVRDGAALRVDAVGLSHATVLRGETGRTVELSLTNTAPPTTGTTATLSSAGLLFGGLTAGYLVTPAPTNATRLAAGAATRLTFTVDVLGTAARGPARVSADLRAVDELATTPVAVSDATNTVWTVQAQGEGKGTALVAAAAFVSRGQTGVPVRLTVQNPGDLPIEVAGTPLFGGSTAGYVVTTQAGGATTVPALATAVLSWTVDVLPTAALGPTTVTAVLVGHIPGSSTLLPASVSGRATWSVQTPAALDASVRIRPARAVRGQRGLRVEVSATNTGASTCGAPASELSAGLLFNGSAGGFSVTTLSAGLPALAAGRSQVLTYVVDVASGAPLGTVTLTAQPRGLDANLRAPVTVAHTASTTFTVVRPAFLEVQSLTPSRLEVRQGQRQVVFEASARNAGDTTASGLDSSLLIDGLPGVYDVDEPAGGGALAGGRSTLLTFVAAVPAGTSLGPRVVSVELEALDSVLGMSVPVSGNPTSVLVVRGPPVLTAGPLRVSRALASRGQSDLTLEVPVANTGDWDLDHLTCQLAFSASGCQTQALPGNPTALAAGRSRVLTFTIGVSSQASPGPVVVSATAVAQEAQTGAGLPPASAAHAGFTILQAARLDVRALTLSRSLVTQGQRGLVVTLGLANTGGTTASGLSAALRFNGSPDGHFVTPATWVSTRLDAGQSTVATFVVDVFDAGPTGPSTVSARVEGADAVSGAPVAVTSGAWPSWTVQPSPALVLQSIVAPRTSLAVGQSMPVTVTLRNDRGQGASVRVTSCNLLATASSVAASSRVTSSVTIPGGSSAAVTLLVTATAAGRTSFRTAVVEAVDVNTGLAAALTRNDAGGGALLEAGLPPVAVLHAPLRAWVLDGEAAVVSLDASETSDPEEDLSDLAWSHVSGPPVSWLEPSARVRNVLVSTAGRHVFRLVATDALGLTATATVAVDVLANHRPVVGDLLPARAYAGERVTFAAVAYDADGGPLTYRWSQASGPGSLGLTQPVADGPGVEVSGQVAGDYVLSVTAVDSNGACGTATAALRIDAAPTMQLDLGIGLNLVSFPLSPFTTDGHLYNAADLVRDSNGGLVARVALGTTGLTRFVPYLAQLSTPFIIQPGQGYAVVARRRERVTLTGRPWAPTCTVQVLRPWVVSLGYPMGVPAGETAQSLLTRGKARFVVRTRVDASGRSHVEGYLPGQADAFPIRPGEGYLFTVDRKEAILLPEGN